MTTIIFPNKSLIKSFLPAILTHILQGIGLGGVAVTFKVMAPKCFNISPILHNHLTTFYTAVFMCGGHFSCVRLYYQAQNQGRENCREMTVHFALLTHEGTKRRYSQTCHYNSYSHSRMVFTFSQLAPRSGFPSVYLFRHPDSELTNDQAFFQYTRLYSHNFCTLRSCHNL